MVSAILIRVLAQVPNTKDYENAWQWVAGALLVIGVPAIVYLFKENAKLNSKMQGDVEKQRDEWKLASQTCANDFGKTSDALKVANDTTVLVVGKVDKLALAQDALSVKLDRNVEQLKACASMMDKLQPAIERLGARFARDDP